MRLDSGNVMSVGTSDELKESAKLRQTKVRLFDFANIRSDPMGVATLTVRHEDRHRQLDFFIVAGSLLSKLNLLQRIDSSLQSKPASSTDDLLREFNDVFKNLGCLPGEYHYFCWPNSHTADPCFVKSSSSNPAKAEAAPGHLREKLHHKETWWTNRRGQ